MRTPFTQPSRPGLRFTALLAGLIAGCGGDAPVTMDDAGVTVCTAHAECDDGLFCNGAEQCMPASVTAGADGWNRHPPR